MVSLEKKMFFLPNKLFVRKDKLFVSFNLAVIPRDMTVTSIELHIPLPKSLPSTTVYIKEIAEKWSEKTLIKGSLPSTSKVLKRLKTSSGQEELNINVTPLSKKWRVDSEQNFGIFILFAKKNIEHLENNPPFLIIDTL